MSVFRVCVRVACRVCLFRPSAFLLFFLLLFFRPSFLANIANVCACVCVLCVCVFFFTGTNRNSLHTGVLS